MNRYLFPLFCGIFIFLNVIMANHILQWNCRSVKANLEEPPAGRGVEFAGCRPAEW